MSVLGKVLAGLATQRNMSPRIGALINVYQTTAIIYAPLTLIGVATTLYGLWGAELIRTYLPWFTVGHLVGCMIVVILLLMVFFYKIIIPSIVAFSVQQTYKHRNPMVTDLRRIQQKQDKILGMLDDIVERISRLENSSEDGN